MMTSRDHAGELTPRAILGYLLCAIVGAIAAYSAHRGSVGWGAAGSIFAIALCALVRWRQMLREDS